MYTSQSICMLAQLVEQLSPKQEAAGSSPAYASAKECTASGKKINLLFCNMNTYESRKPRMCPKEIYSVLMQEFAGFCKTSVDVRY